jgi:NADH dehydrogenase
MTILVTGASGFVGSNIIARLREANYDVRGLSRKLPPAGRRHDGAQYVDGVDVGDASTLTPAMFAGVTSVIHLVGIIQQARGGQTFRRIHVDGTRNVVERAKAARLSGVFVYMSAIGSAADAPAEYSRTKFEAEEIVRGSGLPYAILRPSLILGKGGEFAVQMEDLIRHGGLPVNVPFPFIPVPGSGRNKFQPIDIDDLTACVLRILADDKLRNRVYEVGGATQVSFNELLAGFAAALGVRKPMLHAPIPALRLAAAVMETVLPRPPVTRDQLANLSRDNIADTNDASSAFNLVPRTFDAILDRIYGKSGPR